MSKYVDRQALTRQKRLEARQKKIDDANRIKDKKRQAMDKKRQVISSLLAKVEDTLSWLDENDWSGAHLFRAHRFSRREMYFRIAFSFYNQSTFFVDAVYINTQGTIYIRSEFNGEGGFMGQPVNLMSLPLEMLERIHSSIDHLQS